MRPLLVAALAVLTLLLTAVPAPAKPSRDFAFKHGETSGRTGATFPGGGARDCDPGGQTCSYEVHDFTIAPDEANLKMVVSVTWPGLPGAPGPIAESDAQDDWDLFVYRVLEDGSEFQVASSATGGNTQETAQLLAPLEGPIPPGPYRIYMDNFKATSSQEWEGYVSFEAFVPINVPPLAALTTPAQAVAGQPVTLDASASSDPDGGTITSYAWDVDGNGSFEVDTGTTPTHRATLRAGRAHVGVRIRDDRNGLGFAATTINVAHPPPGDSTVEIPAPPGSITLDLRGTQRLRAIAVRGVVGTLTCPTRCEITGTLRISRSTARRLGFRQRTLATHRRTVSGTGATPRFWLKPRARIIRALRNGPRSVRATVRVTADAQGYERVRFTRRVLIRR